MKARTATDDKDGGKLYRGVIEGTSAVVTVGLRIAFYLLAAAVFLPFLLLFGPVVFGDKLTFRHRWQKQLCEAASVLVGLLALGVYGWLLKEL